MAQKTNCGDMTTAARWKPDRPYNDLPRLPPATELETRPVLKQCVTARAALAELKQAAELNPSYAEPHYVLGRIYHRRGDTKNAEIAFETFHRLKRDNSKSRPQ